MGTEVLGEGVLEYDGVRQTFTTKRVKGRWRRLDWECMEYLSLLSAILLTFLPFTFCLLVQQLHCIGLHWLMLAGLAPTLPMLPMLF